jgi:hypothetical protein
MANMAQGEYGKYADGENEVKTKDLNEKRNSKVNTTHRQPLSLSPEIKESSAHAHCTGVPCLVFLLRFPLVISLETPWK